MKDLDMSMGEMKQLNRMNHLTSIHVEYANQELFFVFPYITLPEAQVRQVQPWPYQFLLMVYPS